MPFICSVFLLRLGCFRFHSFLIPILGIRLPGAFTALFRTILHTVRILLHAAKLTHTELIPKIILKPIGQRRTMRLIRNVMGSHDMGDHMVYFLWIVDIGPAKFQISLISPVIILIKRQVCRLPILSVLRRRLFDDIKINAVLIERRCQGCIDIIQRGKIIVCLVIMIFFQQ